ncbi:hypothetical protein GCM10011613_23780 [Cellvibrio zantedeschiae]|uniref:DUF3592 domain-containing protein n=1 Tax=Cellvibrio zantedeschiae TaxID=1237077 RepID=A0ABQ3B418_9GAMM|nr:hypothetical protein [Cellvibrio zantedeschiae]GGY78382.1 hypothetical protein GCM10011613_23780 [Cellvibrio zantedeschiae]
MLSIERRIIFRIFFSILVFALVGVFAAVNKHFQRDTQALVDNANRVDAEITNKNCSNAGLVYYRFNLEGKEFLGASNACVASCAKALTGEKVQVTYEVNNPDNSICGSAGQIASRFSANYYALGAVGFGLLVVVFYLTRRKID